MKEDKMFFAFVPLLLDLTMDHNILRACSIATRPAFFWLFTLVLMLINSHCIVCSNSSCVQIEREALLRLKQDLRDPSNRLASWAAEDEDCCSWTGVICSAVTGHVHKLDLWGPIDEDGNRPRSIEHKRLALGGTINPSLLDLKHLHHLDLSNNDFGGIRIPDFFGSLPSLRYLNLSHAGFGGEIPHQLGNLTNLLYLDLHVSWYSTAYDGMHCKSLQWISRLTSLQYLDMSSVDLSEAYDWLEVINTLPSLLDLHLSDCGLAYNGIPSVYDRVVNFSSLLVLDLSLNSFSDIPLWVFFKLSGLASLNLHSNYYSGPIPEAIQNMTHLVNLDLSSNSFNGSIPSWLFGLSRLEVVNLGYNQLSGTIPPEIKNLTSMTILDLSSNALEGKVPRSIGGLCELRQVYLSKLSFNQEISQVIDILSECAPPVKLEHLEFWNGQLFGHLTDQIAQFKSLKHLDLSNNSISGPIPASLGTLSNLRYLDITSNHFNGTLPDSFGQLANLEYLKISKNNLDGIVSEAHFASAARLRIFWASGNPLILKVCPCWVPPFQLYELVLGSWDLGQQFPLWIQSQKQIYYLDMSNTQLSGVIPSWLWNFSSEITYLNLSRNHFIGRIPDMLDITSYVELDLSSNYFEGLSGSISPRLSTLDLSNNLLRGSIHKFICHNTSEIRNLQVLNLRKNQLAGEISNCWAKWLKLQIIKLSHNGFVGSVPSSMGSLSFLQSLHMRGNKLSGELPVSLQNLTRLRVLDLSQNRFRGIIPHWVGSNLSKLSILSVRSNEFHGNIADNLCALKFLQILDLAFNNLAGPIPKCFGSFSTMVTSPIAQRYFFRNISTAFSIEDQLLVMKGKLVEYNNILPLVTIIDLSHNRLSGPIPKEITSLSGLLSLNLSSNYLTGEIPSSIGNMGALESLDVSTNRLSGKIPTSMAGMSFLSHLNVSFNNLRGQIPTGTQLQSIDASGFIGNSLCGPPLPQNCSSNTHSPNPSSEDGQRIRGKGPQVDWFYVGMALGFVVGFLGFMGPLLLNRSWRHVYFQSLEDTWHKLSHLCR